MISRAKMKKKLGIKATPKCSIIAHKRASCSLGAEYNHAREPSQTSMLKVTIKKETLTLEALSLIIVMRPRTNIKMPTTRGGTVKMFSLKISESRNSIVISRFSIESGFPMMNWREFLF
jgi:hypothetical protein